MNASLKMYSPTHKTFTPIGGNERERGREKGVCEQVSYGGVYGALMNK